MKNTKFIYNQKNQSSKTNNKIVPLKTKKNSNPSDLVLLSKAELNKIFEALGKLKTEKDHSKEIVDKIDEKNFHSKIVIPEKLNTNNNNDINNNYHIESKVKLTNNNSLLIQNPIKPPQTMAEKKRLQWEKEKVENDQFKDYNPWGRAGAGAPIKDMQGNSINDYSINRQNVTKSMQLDTTRSGHYYSQSGNDYNSPTQNNFNNYTQENIKDFNNYPNVKKGDEFNNIIDNFNIQTNLNNYDNRTNNFQPNHPQNNDYEIRHIESVSEAHSNNQKIKDQYQLNIKNQYASNFTNQTHKNEQNKQWLEDLEKQRLEQKLRKENEKRSLKNDNLENMTWMDKMIPSSTNLAPGRLMYAPPSDQITGRVMTYNENDFPTMTHKLLNIELPQKNNEVAFNQVPNHGRRNYDEFKEYGTQDNTPILDSYHAEQEARRLKILKHQEDLKQQIEENRRRKQFEKEKYSREDERLYNTSSNPTSDVSQMMHEKQISQPVTTIANPNRVLSKEEKEKILFDGLIKAREECIREKQEKFAKKRGQLMNESKIEGIDKVQSNSQCNVNNSNHNDNENESQILENHKYKDSHCSPLKDFGTQTDLSRLMSELSRQSTAIEYKQNLNTINSTQNTSSIQKFNTNNNATSKKNSTIKNVTNNLSMKNSLSAPYLAEDGTDKFKKGVFNNERGTKADFRSNLGLDKNGKPIWGYKNINTKKVFRQSEKDLLYDMEKREARLIRQQELLLQAQKFAHRIPGQRLSKNDQERQIMASKNISNKPVTNFKTSENHQKTNDYSPQKIQTTTNIYPTKFSQDFEKSLNSNNAYLDSTLPTDAHVKFVPFVRSCNILNPAEGQNGINNISDSNIFGEEVQLMEVPMISLDNKRNIQEEQHITNENEGKLFDPTRKDEILQNLSEFRQALRERQIKLKSASKY